MFNRVISSLYPSHVRDALENAGLATNRSPSTALPADVVESVGATGIISVHGGYCGPGASGPGEPIDKLDRACQAHDRGYSKNGYFDVKTDLVVIRDSAKRIFSTDASVTERLAAAGVVAVFGGVVTPFVSVPTTLNRALGNPVEAVASGAASVAREAWNAASNAGRSVGRALNPTSWF